MCVEGVDVRAQDSGFCMSLDVQDVRSVLAYILWCVRCEGCHVWIADSAGLIGPT